jgi:hypothetical protein
MLCRWRDVTKKVNSGIGTGELVVDNILHSQFTITIFAVIDRKLLCPQIGLA